MTALPILTPHSTLQIPLRNRSRSRDAKKLDSSEMRLQRRRSAISSDSLSTYAPSSLGGYDAASECSPAGSAVSSNSIIGAPPSILGLPGLQTRGRSESADRFHSFLHPDRSRSRSKSPAIPLARCASTPVPFPQSLTLPIPPRNRYKMSVVNRGESIDRNPTHDMPRVSEGCESEAEAIEANEANEANVEKDVEKQEEEMQSHKLSVAWSLWEHVADEDPDSQGAQPFPSGRVFANARKQIGILGAPDDDKGNDDYLSACRKVATFGTIEDFMRVWNGVPTPGCVIDNRRMVRMVEDDVLATANVTEHLSAVMLFKDGIQPSWEDAQNANGGHFQFVFRTDAPAKAVDSIWERVVFSLLGNLVAHGQKVTGVRLADKLQSSFVGAKIPTPAVRLEIWHGEMAPHEVSELRSALKDILTEPLQIGDTSYKTTLNPSRPRPKAKASASMERCTCKDVVEIKAIKRERRESFSRRKSVTAPAELCVAPPVITISSHD